MHSVHEYFGEKLTRLYLHCSLAMGCFNPASSDIDLLVVVSDVLSIPEKLAIGERLLRLSTLIPGNSIEISIVTRVSLQNFHHPSPYELHFSDMYKAAFANGSLDFSGEKYDPDLAAHFTVTRARGACLYGAPIAAVFPVIPRRAYLDSIIGGADWSHANVLAGPDEGLCRVPAYAVLNDCRVLSFLEQGLVASKAEGGRWALTHLPPQYRPIIQSSLGEYTSAGSAPGHDNLHL